MPKGERLKGKTYEEVYGEEKAKEIKRRMGKSISKTRLLLFKEGKLVTWNKGKKVGTAWNKGVHMWETREHPKGMKGHKQTEYQKKRNSEFFKNWWKEHPEQREVLSKRMKEDNPNKEGLSGEKNPNWRGGIQNFPYGPEFTPELKYFIKRRDNGECKLCGDEDTKLVVHHINYDKQNNDLENLITLCNRCNSKVNFNREQWMNLFLNSNKYFQKFCEEIKDFKKYIEKLGEYSRQNQ